VNIRKGDKFWFGSRGPWARCAVSGRVPASKGLKWKGKLRVWLWG